MYQEKYQEKYNIQELWEKSTKAIKDFLSSGDFFKFVFRIADLVNLEREETLNFIYFLYALSLKSFPAEEARERLNDFLPNLTEEQKEIIIREIALSFLPSLENFWKITTEEEKYDEKVQRYLSMMEFYLRRPILKRETEFIKKELPVEKETQETKEEIPQEVLPQEERVVTISWEEKKEEKEESKKGEKDDWIIPKIEFKIKEDEKKREKEESVDLSQV